MTRAAPRLPAEPSRADALERELCAEIVSGRWPAGATLPTERALAERAGASRVTVRAAVRSATELGLVRVRQGSGARVLPRSEWRFGVLPAFLRYGSVADAGAAVTELLALRRLLVRQALAQAAGQLRPGALDRARAAVERAFSVRQDLGAFVRADLDMMRAVLDAAGALPTLWLLNQVAAAYLELVEPLTSLLSVPDDYREVHEAMLAALERGDGEGAFAALAPYLDRQEARLLGAAAGARS